MLGVDHEKVRVDPSQVVEVELFILLDLVQPETDLDGDGVAMVPYQ
jgi:hypothetical protein